MPVPMVIDWRSSRAPHTGLLPGLFDGLTFLIPCKLTRRRTTSGVNNGPSYWRHYEHKTNS